LTLAVIMGTYLIHETEQCCTHLQTFPNLKCSSVRLMLECTKPNTLLYTLCTLNDVYNFNYSTDFNLRVLKRGHQDKRYCTEW
jgi:hypothetical protein